MSPIVAMEGRTPRPGTGARADTATMAAEGTTARAVEALRAVMVTVAVPGVAVPEKAAEGLCAVRVTVPVPGPAVSPETGARAVRETAPVPGTAPSPAARRCRDEFRSPSVRRGAPSRQTTQARKKSCPRRWRQTGRQARSAVAESLGQMRRTLPRGKHLDRLRHVRLRRRGLFHARIDPPHKVPLHPGCRSARVTAAPTPTVSLGGTSSPSGGT